MSGYFDYQGVNSGHLEAGPSSFVRPLDLADRRSGATSISRNSRASGASGLTYATNGSAPVPDDNRQSPAEPIRGMPTPVMSPRGLRLRGEERYDDDDDDEEDIEEEEEEEEDDEDPEYMMVDADLSMVSQFGAQNQPPSGPFQEPPPKVMNNKPVPVKVQGGRKGFAGGFFSRLTRLPRLLRNQRGQTVQRQPSHDTVLELPGFGEDSPGYDPFRAHPPSIQQPTSILHHPPSIAHHAPSIPASRQVTSMHYSHYTHDERTEPSPSPMSRDPNDFDSEELDRDHNSGSDEEEGDQHSTHKQSTAAHSVHPSTRFSHHSTHHSNHPPGQDSGRKSNHHSRHPSPHRSPTPSRHTPSRPQTALDGDTTLIHQTQNGEPEAVAVNPLPTSDYKSMGPASLPPSSNDSIAANVNRIHKFMADVYNLPWVAAQVTADYIPDRDGRRFHGMDPNAKRPPKPELTWYPSLHKDLDLLEGETPRSAPVMAHRRRDGHRRALTESTVTPTSAAVTQSVTPSTSYSPRRYSVNSEPTPRHQRHTRDFRQPHHRHRRRHRDHSRPHSPPIYPMIASPQPLYLYPGPASPPMMPIPQPQPVIASSASSPRSRRGITSPAVPVYMIPMPAPVYQPMSGLAYASPHHVPSQPAQPQPAQSQPAQSQPATNPPTSA